MHNVKVHNYILFIVDLIIRKITQIKLKTFSP